MATVYGLCHVYSVDNFKKNLKTHFLVTIFILNKYMTHDVILIYHLVMKTVPYKFLILLLIIIIMFSRIYVSIL